MPKLKRTDTEQMNTAYRKYLVSQLVEMDYTPNQLCTWLNCSRATYQNKKREPETITLKELRTICKKLKINDRQLCEICGVTYHGTIA